MAIYDLTVLKSKGGTIFVCPNCLAAALPAMGATDRAELRHLFICPKCSRTMGEWLTIEHRDQELKALADKLARPA